MKTHKGVIVIDLIEENSSLVPISIEEDCLRLVGDDLVAVSVMTMDRSLYLWISDYRNSAFGGGEASSSGARFGNMSCGMPGLFASLSSEGPISTVLVAEAMNDSGVDDYGESLSRRLAHRFNMQIFVSDQIQKYKLVPQSMLLIEKSLIQFLTQCIELS